MKKKNILLMMLFVVLAISFSRYENINDYMEKRAIAKYPYKPIEIIVAYKEGGGTDVGARLLASIAEQYAEVPITIQNIKGGDGEVGFAELSKSKPNGYTIGFINLPTFLSLNMQRETEYDKEDIVLIMNYVYDPAVLVIRSDSEWVTIEDFIQYSKANPLSMTISNNGKGASNHIAAAYFEYEAGIKVTHVPFGGTADMLEALRYKHVKASVAKISEVADLVEAGELTILGTFTENRIDGFYDVPTLQEKGLDITFGSARALAAPKDTPEEIIEFLRDLFKEVVENEEHIRQAKEANLPIKYMSPIELQRYIEHSEEYLNRIIPKIKL